MFQVRAADINDIYILHHVPISVRWTTFEKFDTFQFELYMK